MTIAAPGFPGVLDYGELLSGALPIYELEALSQSKEGQTSRHKQSLAAIWSAFLHNKTLILSMVQLGVVDESAS